MVEQLAYSEAEVAASITRESFWEYVQEYWDKVSPAKPVWNWHIPYLCDELQTVAERVFENKHKLYDLVINVSPGTTKSSLISILYPTWIWSRMPTARIISGSYSDVLALDLSNKARQIVKSEKYRAMFPEVQIRKDQDTKGYYLNTLMGDRFAAGAGGTVTGMHAHFLLVDDPINPKGADSAAETETANQWLGETISPRKVDRNVSVMVLLHQRLGMNDSTAYWMGKGKKNVRHMVLPAELTDDVKPSHLRRFYVGGLFDPVRLGKSALEEAKADLGNFGYSAQYLQAPQNRESLMFDTSKFNLDQIPPPDKRFSMIVRFWDKATTPGGGAYTVGIKMGIIFDGAKKDVPRFWVLDLVRGQWGSDQREKTIMTTAVADGRHVIVGVEEEPGSGGKDSADDTVRRLTARGYRCRKLKVGKSDGDKMKRADPYSYQVNSGAVYLAPGHWVPAYLQEIGGFCETAKYKDQVDASSGACTLLRNKRKVGFI